MKDIAAFPRLKLGIFPTPVQRLENISRILGTNIYIKRDDLTGVGLGGNKVRKLEFLLAEAKAQGAELIFTTGGAQSNHAMLTAACCKKLGLTPILILKARGVTARRGNLLLEHLMDTDVRFMDTDDYGEIYAAMDRIGQASGKRYYKIPCGGSTAVGALGYAACGKELREQEEAMGLRFRYLVCADGSGGTHAGLGLGARLWLPEAEVLGMAVDHEPFGETVSGLMNEAAALMELELTFRAGDIRIRNVCGPGYAVPSPEGNAAVRLLAEREGLFLDPIYTGKAFGGLVSMAREGAFRPEDNVLFLYSGGAGGLFAVDMD